MSDVVGKEVALSNGLRALPDEALDLARVHLQAGLPMTVAFGWEMSDQEDVGGSAPCGCLVGVSMSRSRYIELAHVNRDYLAPRPGMRTPLSELADRTFPEWARQYVSTTTEPLPAPARARLSELLDMEMERRRRECEPEEHRVAVLASSA